MNKDEKRKALAEYKRRQKEAFLASLPMSAELFRELFDYLDEKLSEEGCQDDLRLTTAFLESQDCDTEAVLEWLEENGGGCDCEETSRKNSTIKYKRTRHCEGHRPVAIPLILRRPPMVAPIKSWGLPHQSADWFAMTHSFLVFLFS